MKSYQAISATGTLPQSSAEHLTVEINRYAGMGYEVCTSISITEGERGSYFIASIVMIKEA